MPILHEFQAAFLGDIYPVQTTLPLIWIPVRSA